MICIRIHNVGIDSIDIRLVFKIIIVIVRMLASCIEHVFELLFSKYMHLTM